MINYTLMVYDTTMINFYTRSMDPINSHQLKDWLSVDKLWLSDWVCWCKQVEGNNAHADDAIMLDKDGFVSETNATNIVSLLPFFALSLFYCSNFLSTEIGRFRFLRFQRWDVNCTKWKSSSRIYFTNTWLFSFCFIFLS